MLEDLFNFDSVSFYVLIYKVGIMKLRTNYG